MRRVELLHPAQFVVFGLTIDSFQALPTPALIESLQQHRLF
jgi:hypothetical protein